MKTNTKESHLEKTIKDLAEIGKDRELREKWKNSIQRKPESDKKPGLKIISFKLIKWGMGIAASLLILFNVGLLNPGKNLSSTAGKNIASAQQEILSDVFRSDSDHQSEIEKAKKSMSNRSYQLALQLFENNISQLGLRDQLAMALTYNELKQSKSAITILTNIISKNDKYISSEAKWILANIYVQQNNIEKSSDLLSQLIKSKEYKSKQAAELLLKFK